MDGNAEHLIPDGNAAAFMEINNVFWRYSTYSYAVDRVNEQIYAITFTLMTTS